MEVTKWLKPSISVSRIGDSARVNAEQALYGAFEVKHTFHTNLLFFFIPVSLFDLESRFFAPTHARVEADAHRAVKVGRRSALAVRSVLSRPRL